MNEEITVRFGGDLGPLSTALRGVKGMMKSAGESIKDSFKDAFHHLTAPLSVAGAFEAIKSVMESVKNIKRISESTGLDTGVTQDMLNLGKAAGIAGDAIESAMDKFVRGLKDGQDPAQALDAIADKMEGITDPADRARLATEAFGKAGVKLIPILKEGSEGIRKMSEEWGKLSDAEIDQLERSNKELEKVGNRGKVLLAETIIGGENLGKSFNQMPWWQKMIPGFNLLKAYQDAKNAAPDDQPGTVTTEASKTPAELNKSRMAAAAAVAKDLAEKEKFLNSGPRERELELTRQILAARRQIEDESDPEKQKKIAEEILDLETKRKSITDEIANKQKESAEKQKEISEQIAKKQIELRQFQSTIADRNAQYGTLQEVANAGYAYFQGNQWKWQSSPLSGQAMRVMGLEARAHNERLWGNLSGAKADESIADTLREGLEKAGAIAPQDHLKIISEKNTLMQKDIATLTAKLAELKKSQE